MVPDARPRSYYGLPILQRPAWRDEVPLYLFAGGLGGVSLAMAAGARRAGQEELARRALLTGLAGLAVSPVLLVRDLGRPARFLAMLRVFRPTSPMSVGSWLLSACGACAGAAAAGEVLGIARPAARAAEVAAGALGLGVATYTAVLVADTSVPLWHGAREELPFVFAGSAAAAAGGVLMALTPRPLARPARILGAGGAVVELLASRAMEGRLGEQGEPLRRGEAGRWRRASQALAVSGAAVAALGAGRSRTAAVLGGASLAAASLCTRFAVFRAGQASALDPAQLVGPQRAGMVAAGR